MPTDEGNATLTASTADVEHILQGCRSSSLGEDDRSPMDAWWSLRVLCASVRTENGVLRDADAAVKASLEGRTT